MTNFLFLVGVIIVGLIVILPFIYLSNKPSSLQPEISYELLRPGFRRFTIYVPNDYTGENPAPLILSLHYAGHGIPFYGEMILQDLVKPAFEELKPIIVSPDCQAKYWHQPESEQFVLDLLDSIPEQYNINTKQILITGYSLGGIGTWYFAGKYPERFSAAIVMASKPPDDVFDINWKLPLIVIHGREDEVFPFQKNKETVIKLENKGVDIELRTLDGVKHNETQYFVAALKNTIPWLLDNWHN